MSLADFIECTTTSIAGSSGNGPVTLARQGNYPMPGDIWGSAARMAEYFIEDTVGGKFENGWGLISAGVLTRSRVYETWDGTTYSTINPSALAFGSTPAAGNVRIRIAPSSAQFMPVPPGINVASSSGDAYKGWQMSAHVTSTGNGSDGAPLTAGTEIYFPYLSLIRGYVDGIGIQLSAAGSSGNGLKIALYECDYTGLPGQCITQFNAFSVATSGWKTDTTPSTWTVKAGPLRLNPGWYYIGLLSNDSSARILKWANNQETVFTPAGRSDAYGFGCVLTKAAENSYATGLPTGVPSGSYSLQSSGGSYGTPVCGLRINN